MGATGTASGQSDKPIVYQGVCNWQQFKWRVHKTMAFLVVTKLQNLLKLMKHKQETGMS
jgi:hypothetical protein